MGANGMGLYWLPGSVAKVMADNDIQCRADLATRLEEIGISRKTVYRAFTEDWDGKASSTVLAAVAVLFKVPLAELVAEPFRRAG